MATPCRSISPDIAVVIHFIIRLGRRAVAANVEELGDALVADGRGWSSITGSSSSNGLILVMPWIL